MNQPQPTPEQFTHDGVLMQPHYDNAVRAWEKMERMEQNEIVEGNELISEFMGRKGFDGAVWYYEGLDGFQSESGKYLKYHSSWDWLMPVVEEIERNGCLVEIWLSLGRGCRIYKPLSEIQSWQTVIESNSTIEAVWLAAIEFIKWYNQNK